ncbi:MAG: holin [Prevotella sp.]|uniref:lipopolysaccharide biosynthesis protein n=1 Tax=Prevotella sp. TaxID=59823 RepID=UPI00257B9684|nr:holin [Prevotella sp.]MBS5876524.1 holin [Prevotella sp.]
MTDTSQNNKRIAKNTLLLYIRMLLLMVISLYTSRIVLNALGVNDYGIYNVVGGIVVILAFLNNAMAGSTQRFLNFEMGMQDSNALQKVFSTSIHIHVIVALIVLILGETIGLWFLNTNMNIPETRITAANYVYQFSLVTCIANFLTVPYNATIIAHERMSAFAYLSILEGVLKFSVAIAIYYSPFDKLVFYGLLMLFVGLINNICYATYAYRHFTECKGISKQINKDKMHKMLSFSGWTIFGNLGYILHTQGIAIIINMFFTVAVNAAQGIANQVNGVVQQFLSNFLLALNPQLVKSYASGDIEAMHKLIIRGCKFAFCLVAFFIVPLVLETPTILQTWLGVVPEYTVIFVRMVLFILLVNSLSGIFSTSKGATGNIKIYQITLTIIGAFHLPLAWAAFALGYGPEYSMYVYLVIVIILQIVRAWFVCNSLQLSKRRLFSEVVVRCSLVILIGSILPALLHMYLPTSLVSSIITCIVGMISVAVSSLFIALTPHERQVVHAYVEKIIKRHER